MKLNKSNTLRQSYNYYLLEAARNAKDQDPLTLYGKILQNNPGNEEAFNFVFNRLYSDMQYEEAGYVLNKYKKAKGETKQVLLMELKLNKKMGNTGKAIILTKELFELYPNDSDIKEEYVNVLYNEAKTKIQNEQYVNAIDDLKQVLLYGDSSMVRNTQILLFNTSYAYGDLYTSLDVLNDMILSDPYNYDNYLKSADIYFKLQRYHNAMSSYEQAILLVPEQHEERFKNGYGEMATMIIKEFNERYQYSQSLSFVIRWLKIDSLNNAALRYAVNLSYIMSNYDDMEKYATIGSDAYPDDMYFKIKLITEEYREDINYESIYQNINYELLKNPFHKELINAFVQVTENYSKQLIKRNEPEKAIDAIETALSYAPNNRSLMYMKGVAYEKLKQYDKAYYYQSFYSPSPMELEEFKSYLNYLKYKSYKKEIGIEHLRSRFGHDNIISTISSLQYKRFIDSNTFTGRINFAGRDLGKGYQFQFEWEKVWKQDFRSKIDLAAATKFFPNFIIHTSLFHDFNFLGGIEGELGLGYRRLERKDNLFNLVLGATKELDDWRFNIRFNNFLLNGDTWLYNISAQARYYLNTPNNYIFTMASVGSSPDINMIDYQFYRGFSVINNMVGLGGSCVIYKTISLGVIGAWYNYFETNNTYNNLYTIQFNINVVF